MVQDARFGFDSYTGSEKRVGWLLSMKTVSLALRLSVWHLECSFTAAADDDDDENDLPLLLILTVGG